MDRTAILIREINQMRQAIRVVDIMIEKAANSREARRLRDIMDQCHADLQTMTQELAALEVQTRSGG
ncbi:MAG: hypothetical protein U1C74_14585 [Phenylobacterium sp.]|nr:hypothetical protein [Phenylobacterium sp.]